MDEGKIIASGTKQELVELVKERTRINIKLDKITGNMPVSYTHLGGN